MVHKKKSVWEKNEKEFSILIRYTSLVLLIFIFQTDLFNRILEIVFNQIAYWFLNLFTNTILQDSILYINNQFMFLIVDECLAASAYIFIATILLTMPINLKLNFNILWKSLIVFTFVNLIRILFLMWVHLIFGETAFNNIHLIFYEAVSGILVALIIIYFLKKKQNKKTLPSFLRHKIFNFIIQKIKIKKTNTNANSYYT